ncbi:hypothetical protein BDR06DRAFT_148926 [Suillus hirtellus]|nr:hypothetical protein BDR06DRAFT_148926 [Suillus hirtellus]
MQLTLSAIILFGSILFIASVHFTQPHSLTSTASYKALLVTAFLSSGSLIHTILTIPRIRVILQRPVFPLLWLSVGILFNASTGPSMMVTFALISWEQTRSVGLFIFCIVFTVLSTILCILADILLDTITTSYDVTRIHLYCIAVRSPVDSLSRFVITCSNKDFRDDFAPSTILWLS